MKTSKLMFAMGLALLVIGVALPYAGLQIYSQVFDEMDSITDWGVTGVGSTISLETSIYMDGPASVKFTAAGAGHYIYRNADVGTVWDFSEWHFLRFHIYPEADVISIMITVITTSSNFSAWDEWYTVVSGLTTNSWNTIELDLLTFISFTNGSPTTTNLAYGRQLRIHTNEIVATVPLNIDYIEQLSDIPPSEPQITIAPGTAEVTTGNTVTFTSSVIEGVIPYSVEWFLNNVSQGLSDTYLFAEIQLGSYTIHAMVTDAINQTAISNTAVVTVSEAVVKSSISGFVKNEANQAIQALITVDDLETSTDTSGYYEFLDLIPGTFIVTASADGYITQSQTVNAGDSNQGVVVTLDFTLITANGEPPTNGNEEPSFTMLQLGLFGLGGVLIVSSIFMRRREAKGGEKLF